jgi:hypothetical protein
MTLFMELDDYLSNCRNIGRLQRIINTQTLPASHYSVYQTCLIQEPNWNPHSTKPVLETHELWAAHSPQLPDNAAAQSEELCKQLTQDNTHDQIPTVGFHARNDTLNSNNWIYGEALGGETPKDASVGLTGVEGFPHNCNVAHSANECQNFMVTAIQNSGAGEGLRRSVRPIT